MLIVWVDRMCWYDVMIERVDRMCWYDVMIERVDWYDDRMCSHDSPSEIACSTNDLVVTAESLCCPLWCLGVIFIVFPWTNGEATSDPLPGRKGVGVGSERLPTRLCAALQDKTTRQGKERNDKKYQGKEMQWIKGKKRYDKTRKEKTRKDNARKWV